MENKFCDNAKMPKKVKKNASNSKKIGKKYSGENESQVGKKLKKEKFDNDEKAFKVKDQNLKFKSKQKKGKLTKKIKQAHKNEQKHTATNIVNPDIAKVVNLKRKGQNQKTELHPQKGKKQQQKQAKQKSSKKQQIKDKSDQLSKKINGNQNATKKGKFKHEKNKMKQEKRLDDKAAKLNALLGKKQKRNQSSKSAKTKNNNVNKNVNGHNLNITKLEKLLVTKQKERKEKMKKGNTKPESLRERMMVKLRASRFRYLNESLYNSESSESKQFFKDDPDAFKAYHDGYKQQVEQWPMNPLDVIVSSIKKMPKEHIIADFGCGDAKLAASISNKVHSFDFVSLNKNVTVCDMAHTPLLTNGVHVVIFCLSLMGTNLKDYIIEANRVLKKDGVLKIAEVESRFEQVEDFINAMSKYGFRNTWKDLSHNLFYFLDFKKEKDIHTKKGNLPSITLKPCLYKKR